jgi:transposase
MSNPVGRPSKYNPAFCERVIALGKLGKSIEQIACDLDVGTKTIYNWRDEHEEFLHALDMAREFEQNWWETIAQTHMIEEQGAASATHPTGSFGRTEAPAVGKTGRPDPA